MNTLQTSILCVAAASEHSIWALCLNTEWAIAPDIHHWNVLELSMGKSCVKFNLLKIEL